MVRERQKPFVVMRRKRLSRQRTAVLVGLANGKTDRQMAKAMGIRVSTVQSHVAYLFNDLQVHSREHAVALGIKLGFLTEREIVLDGECPGPAPHPNYCRCTCSNCQDGNCGQHAGNPTWLGDNPSHWCLRRLHSHCIDKACTCGCGHNEPEDE
jgi:DNA-binding CsgD family transcriptional regulator